MSFLIIMCLHGCGHAAKGWIQDFSRGGGGGGGGTVMRGHMAVSRERVPWKLVFAMCA